MKTLATAFAEAKAQNRAALIGYLPAGFPSRDEAPELISAMVAGGADIVEVGMPYSDPVMDGPVIQGAAEIALRGGATMQDVLAGVRAAVSAGAAACVMSYWNPIEKYGPSRLAADLAQAGGTGAITPDLSPQEAASWMESTDAQGIGRVFLVAPSSTDERLAMVTSASSGFVYAASLMGVTGNAEANGDTARTLLERTRTHTALPIAVGLGVSTPEQAKVIAQFADGVIVGSAFVRAVTSAGSHAQACEAVTELAAKLREGVTR